MSVSKPADHKVDCHREKETNLISHNSSFFYLRSFISQLWKHKKWSQMATHTYKCCVFHHELRLIGVCVAFQDVSVPVLEDDFFIWGQKQAWHVNSRRDRSSVDPEPMPFYFQSQQQYSDRQAITHPIRSFNETISRGTYLLRLQRRWQQWIKAAPQGGGRRPLQPAPQRFEPNEDIL